MRNRRREIGEEKGSRRVISEGNRRRGYWNRSDKGEGSWREIWVRKQTAQGERRERKENNGSEVEKEGEKWMEDNEEV